MAKKSVRTQVQWKQIYKTYTVQSAYKELIGALNIWGPFQYRSYDSS